MNINKGRDSLFGFWFDQKNIESLMRLQCHSIMRVSETVSESRSAATLLQAATSALEQPGRSVEGRRAQSSKEGRAMQTPFREELNILERRDEILMLWGMNQYLERSC